MPELTRTFVDHHSPEIYTSIVATYSPTARLITFNLKTSFGKSYNDMDLSSFSIPIPIEGLKDALAQLGLSFFTKKDLGKCARLWKYKERGVVVACICYWDLALGRSVTNQGFSIKEDELLAFIADCHAIKETPIDIEKALREIELDRFRDLLE